MNGSAVNLTPRYATLVELTRGRAARQPDRCGYTFLADDTTKTSSLSYAELDLRARAIGAWLQQADAAGTCALLLYPPGLDYIAAFFGCLYAGVVAIPAYPPTSARLDRALPQRLRAIVRDAQPRIALTTEATAALGAALAAQAADFQSLHWVPTDSLADGLADEWRPPALSGDTLAFVQYTSGSTAAPKGVMLTHANLLHNLALIEHGFGHTPDSRGVIWLPPYHDMGLIGGILQPLYAGFPVTLMSPLAFLQRPLRWLEAISDFKATTSGGPNFAYDLCVRKITPEQRATLDLSSWRVAFNGAEPVRAETLDRFAATFAECGFRREAFYPCYGLAEATLIVSGGRVDAPPTVREFQAAALAEHQVVAAAGDDRATRMLVGSGEALPDQQVRIVDPDTLRPCPPDRVGEIWVAGPSVAQGYWNRQEETERSFHTTIDGDSRTFLRTGDLGFLHDGELFVAGRLKDLIIIRGRNHYPQDIEHTVERSHAALRPGAAAAFAVDVDDEERLVVVCEVERQQRHADIAQVAGSVRQAVAEQHELQAYAVVLLKPGGMPKTSSGKIQRHACRAAFLAGTLDAIGSSVHEATTQPEPTIDLLPADLLALPSASRQAALEAYLRSQVARVLRVVPDSIDAHQPLSGLGLDSLMAVELQHTVEAGLGIVVPMAAFLQEWSIGQLAADIGAQAAAGTAQPIEPVAPTGAHPLSAGQRALWFLHQLAPESAAYTIAQAVRVRGALDAAALQRAFARLSERHAALRTTFADRAGEPVQQIDTEPQISFQIEDATGWSLEMIHERLSAAARRPFDLQRGPLLRINLFSQATGHVLLLAIHHTIADLWSLDLLMHEMGLLYAAERAGYAAPLAPLALSYVDYARWQAQMLAGAEGERLWSYWRDHLADAATTLDLPTDRPRPAVQSYRGTTRAFALDASLTQRLKALSQTTGVTLYTTLLTAFQTLLHRYTGQRDILVGSPTTGRSRAEWAGLLGYFVNLLPMRADFGGHPTFQSLLAQVRQTVLGAFAHQDYPLPLLVERLQPDRDPSRHPLFQVVFALQTTQARQDGVGAATLGAPGARLRLGSLDLESVALDQQIAQFDLTLFMWDQGDRLSGAVEYNTDLFDAATIARMVGHFQTLLASIAANPEQPIAHLALLTEAEQQQMLVEWNRSEAEYPRAAAVHTLIEVQAARTPDVLALVFDGQALSYAELNTRANQLAHYLRAQGVGPDVLVALCVERSLEMIVGMLAILKAGGAYVPLDPAYPAERLQYMLSHSRAPVILTQAALVERLPEHQAQVFCLDADWERLAAQPTTNPPRVVLPDHLAYIIFTSGSTGRPKGVMVTQRGLINLVYGLRAYFADPQVQRTGLITSISFDISVNQIFPTLIFGRTLHVIPDAVKLDSRALLRYLDAHAIHLLDAVPSYMHAVLNEVAPEQPPNGLRYLLIGGEKLEQRLLQAVFGQIGPAVEIVNIYGLTEISDINALGVLRASDLGKPITVGKPLQNNRIYILDQHQQPQPIGIAGEVCVAGASVSRGYLFRPELTAERFVACPFEDGALMVRTGDLGRWRADGTIEILGRIDHQVKIRGFRIEIGEIEAVLCQHEAVHEAVVTLREDTSPASGHPQKRLVAYIEQKNKRTKEQGDEIEAVPTRAPGPVTPDFRAYLKDRLPDYMVPSAFVFLDTLPKTPNGKIDRRALPAPELAAELDECFVAPRNPIEDLLASVWADVLGVERVGTRDNFFELGGHSLLATQIASRVREAFQVELPLHTLFELPTVAELAEQIQRARRSASHLQAPPIVPLAMDEPLPLSFAQQRLWILDQLEPGNVAYNIPAALRLTGPLDVLALDRSLSEIVRRHAVLRSTITATDGVAAQVVDPFFSLLLMPLDLRALPAADRQAEAERLIVEESQQPFDLSFGPLIRCTLLQLDDREHLLLLTLHHIVADGWSLGVLVRELETLYTAFLEGLPAPLPDLPIQYGDYAAWQRQWLQGEVLDRQIDYWKAQLAGVGVLDLPLDHPRPPVRTFRSGRQTLTIERALTDRLAAFNRRQGVTLFMTLLAAFKLLLHRWSGQTDIVVGSPIAGRTRAETEDLIGLFLNTLVLRSDLSGDPGFVELLRRVREVCLQAYAHQDVPFEKLLEELQPERNLSHTPLFQVFFNMLNYPYRHCELPGLQLEVLAPPDIGAKFDLTLYVEERDAGIFCDLVYNADLFSEARMAALLDQFQHLLAQLVAQPETPIGAYTLVTTAARAYLPDPTVALDGGCEGVVHELVVKQARQTPERIALIDPHTRWTYAELETRSNQLAHDLLAHGIRRGECVAIYGHRSAALIWALLGVLKAGAAFTILDPSYPAARLIDYLQVAWPKGWLQLAAAGPSPDALTDYVATLGCRWTLELPRRADELPDRLASRPTSDPDVDVVPDDLAYVAFTSGSTGRPKGILGTHRPLVHFLAWHRDTFGFGAADRFSMLSGLAHDPLLRDIFTPLILGATLCIPDPDALNTPGYLRAWMQQQAVTVSHLTPPLGHLLSIAPHASDASNGAASLPDLRYVFFGGDVLTRHDVERVHLIAPDAQLVNFYGATETPQGIAYYVLPQPQPDMAADAGDQSKAIVPLGRGIADVQLLVLNAARQPAGVGELGEIFVRTSYLARGYSDDTARTDERFIANPFTGCQQGRPAWAPGVPGDRLYRTADLGRYLPDGNVMFAGRADQQVKIRGFRIEPSEVEAAIERHPAVREVAVVAREDVPGEKRLVAYVVPSTAKAGGGALWAWESPMLSSPAPTAAGAEAGGEGRAATRETRELRSFVQSLLPAYMVPSAFVVLDALPLTPNGKLDRRALPRPEDQRSPAARVLPQTELERSIAAIWQEVLHVDRLGVDDNFFDLGGSSVHIVQVHSKLRDLLQRDMPVVELFKYPTVGALAKWLSQGPNARPSFEEIDDRVRKQHEALDWQRQLRADLDE